MFHAELYLHESPWAQRTVTPWQCRSHMLPVNAMHAGGHPYQGKDAVVFQWTAQSTYSQHQSTYSQHTVNTQSTHSQHKSVFCRKLWFFVHKRAWCYAIKTYFIDLNKVIRVVQILTPFLKKTKGSLWKAWLCWLCVDCMLTVCWLYVDCMLTVCWLYVDCMCMVYSVYIPSTACIWYQMFVILSRCGNMFRFLGSQINFRAANNLDNLS